MDLLFSVEHQKDILRIVSMFFVNKMEFSMLQCSLVPDFLQNIFLTESYTGLEKHQGE